LAAAPAGRSFAAWAQADSTGNIKVWASAATAATAAWTVTNTSVDALPAATYTYRLVGLPDGSGDLYLDIPAVLNDTHCSRRRWTPGAPTWTAQSLPAGCQAWDSGYAVATASNGNQLWFASGTDTWSTYDDALNQVVKVMAPPTSATATDYMLGFSNSSVLGTFNSNATILTSSSGISAVIANTGFDVLPTAPTLSSASSIDSLWAWYLK
jgi:hypothetical protein